LEENIRGIIPNDFEFINSAGWVWLPHSRSTEKAVISSAILQMF
jgi:hypothetical protein